MRDLGTWYVRAEFSDGTGFIQKFQTGRRFCEGTESLSPLGAKEIPPTWSNEADLLRSMEYIFTDGNYACDCNRRSFLAQANVRPDDINFAREFECGYELILKRLTALAPDGREIELRTEVA